MCGFIGYSSSLSENNDFIEKKFNFYHDKMHHRGPDFQTTQIIKNDHIKFNIGFSRLSIQDLSSNSNKIFEQGKCTLLFNGEIYNKNYIKNKFLPGIKLETETDTEILLNFLKKEGVSKLKEIEGIFAFVYIDLNNNSMILCRDYSGTKPLYYSIINNNIYFSSEAWFLYSINKKEIDYDSLNFYLKFGFSPSEKTMVKNVFKISSNCSVKLDLKNNSIKKEKIYNNLGFCENEIELEKLSNSKINNNIVEIISKNLIGQRNIGTFLSGGVDSTIISLEAQKFSEKIEAYTSIYKGYENKDLDFKTTIKLCKDYKIKLNVSEINMASNSYDDFLNIAGSLDEPISNLNFFSSYKQAELAKKNNTSVVLSGDGSDEIFGGYRKYITYKIYLSLQHLYFLNNKLKIYKNQKKNELPLFFLRKLKNENIEEFLNKEIAEKVNLSQSHLINHENTDSNLANINYFDFNNWLTDEHNFKLDRTTMLNSVEGRVPFQDINLLKHFNVNNITNKINFFKNKIPLRRAFTKLPNYVLQQKKRGWFLPEKKFLNDLLEFSINEIFDNTDNELLNNNYIKKHLDVFKYQKISKYEIINILMLQIWFKNFKKC